MTEYQIDIVFPGFSGYLPRYGMGWGTVALIRSNKHTILLDTGSAAMRAKLLPRLTELGVKASDIDAVLLTHLHHDHAANVDYFPGSTFYFSATDYVSMCDLRKRDPFSAESALFFLRTMKSHLIQNGEEIFPDIFVMDTPGHTAGSVTYFIKSSAGVIALAGDALKNRSECDREMANITICQETSHDSIVKIKEAADRILPGHDCWLKKKGGTFIPEGGNDVEFLFREGLTVNNGKSSITIRLD